MENPSTFVNTSFLSVRDSPAATFETKNTVTKDASKLPKAHYIINPPFLNISSIFDPGI